MAEGRGGASGPLCPAGQSQAAPQAESLASPKALGAAGRSLQQLRSGSPRSPSAAAQACPQSLYSEEGASGYLPSSLAYLPSSLAPPSALGAPARRDARQRSLVPSQNQKNGQRTGYEDEDGALHCGEPCGTEPFCPFHSACGRPITLRGSSLQAGDTHREHDCSWCKAMKDRGLHAWTTRSHLSTPAAPRAPPQPNVAALQPHSNLPGQPSDQSLQCGGHQ